MKYITWALGEFVHGIKTAFRALMWLFRHPACCGVALILSLLIIAVGSVQKSLGTLLLFASLPLLTPSLDQIALRVECDVLKLPIPKWTFLYSFPTLIERFKLFIVLIIFSICLLPVFIQFQMGWAEVMIKFFCIGTFYFDYPYFRRGYDLNKRIGKTLRRPWALMGLGLFSLFPPITIIGGVLLALEDPELSS